MVRCKFAFNSSVLIGSDVNQNGFWGTTVVSFTRCDFNQGTVFLEGGTLTFTLCRFQHQKQNYGGWAFNGGGTYYTKFDRCRMNGGGCDVN